MLQPPSSEKTTSPIANGYEPYKSRSQYWSRRSLHAEMRGGVALRCLYEESCFMQVSARESGQVTVRETQQGFNRLVPKLKRKNVAQPQKDLNREAARVFPQTLPYRRKNHNKKFVRPLLLSAHWHVRNLQHEKAGLCQEIKSYEDLAVSNCILNSNIL